MEVWGHAAMQRLKGLDVGLKAFRLCGRALKFM